MKSEGIDRNIVNARFIMNVRPGAVAGVAAESDDTAVANLLPGGDVEGVQVGVIRDVAAILENNQIAVAGAIPTGKGDNSAMRGDH